MLPLALLLAACTGDPVDPADDTDRPAVEGGASLREVAFFQGVEVQVAVGDDAVTPRAAPLIAGRPAVVRAMIDLPAPWTAVELTLSVDLTRAGETRTFSAARTIDAASEDASPESGLLVEIPADAMAADTTYAVRLTTADATHDRFPAADDAPLDALVTGPLKLVLVPFEVNGFVPDTSPAVVDGLRDAVMASLPVTGVEVTVGEVQVWTGAFDLGDINVRVGQIQEAAMFAGEVSWDTYYYGLATGVADRDAYRGITGTSEDGGDAPVRAFFAAGAAFGDARSQETLVHELGHVHGLLHTACDGEDNPDPDYPHAGGAIGVEGYDLRTGRFYPPETLDIMTYCEPRWISAYSYAKAAQHVIRAQTFEGYD
jgi:hypothetical protein